MKKTAITNITQRKDMEDTIQRSRAFLQTVIDAIPDVLVVIDADYRIALANRAAREMAGGADPAPCLTCHQLLHHGDTPCEGDDHPCPLHQVITARAPVTMTHTHYDARGKEFFVELSAAPVLDETGEVSHIIEVCRDVTDRLQLERALRLTQFSVDHAGDAVLWLGSDARYFYANARACRHLGYSREELLSMTVFDVNPNFQAAAWPKHWEEVKRRGSFTFESQHRTKEGGLVPVEITVNYIAFDGKEYNCAFVRDITERKRAEQALQRDLLKVRAGWVYLKDEQNGCLALSACRGFLVTCPQDNGAALPKNCSCQQAMDDKSARVVHAAPICLQGGADATAQEGLKCHVNVPLKAKDKVLGVMNLAYAEDRDFPPDEIQTLTSIGHQIGMAVDNARLYRDLWGKELTALHLLGKVISAHEDERGRIARELHDAAGQNLTALLLQLGCVEQSLPGGAGEAKRLLQDLQVLAGSIVAEIRRMMKDLRPSLLDDMGLVPAISSFAGEQLKRSGVKFSIDVQGVRRKLAPPVETALFRIFQEAITNIAKHAEAKNARIELRFKDASVEARIADDGRGFDPVGSRTTWQTFGLLGIEERVAILDGRLRIDSQAGQGTEIQLEVPTPSAQR